jgi:hypothetical protein
LKLGQALFPIAQLILDMMPIEPMRDERSILNAVLSDGTPLIALTGVALLLSGGFAVMQSIYGELLPQDSHAIGMNAAVLAHAANSRLLGFIFHDRVAYGGTLISIGAGYLWLATFPLKDRERWAWWALAVSGTIGFLAFLTYLGQRYLDSWHGVATLFLLPVFCCGLWRAYPTQASLETLRPPADGAERWGRILLGACGVGLVLAGITIACFGMTTVFVPSDLRFVGLDRNALHHISPMLIPLISHDRAGFGGGLCCIGCLLLFMACYAELNRSLVEIVAVMGIAGFGCAIGVHFAVGYVDFMHLLPAFLGCFIFLIAELLLWAAWRAKKRITAEQAVAFRTP